MLKEIADALKPQEERVEFAGRTLTVRELGCAADLTAAGDSSERGLLISIHCIFEASGQRVFTEDDLPELRGASRSKFDPLLQAVLRVNGFKTAEPEKNSEAAPGSG